MQITTIKGIGDKTAALLKKLEIETVEDALLYYPRNYIQFPEMKGVSEAIEGEVAAVVGKIVATPTVKKVRSMQLTLTTIGDLSAKMNLVWFRMPYLKNSLSMGESYVFYGKVLHKNGRFRPSHLPSFRSLTVPDPLLRFFFIMIILSSSFLLQHSRLSRSRFEILLVAATPFRSLHPPPAALPNVPMVLTPFQRYL